MAKKIFLLQWHITNDCNKRCPICYIPKEDRNKTPPSLEESFHIIDNFSSLIIKWGISGNLILTGGDPLLNPNLEEILEYANSKYLGLHILGNPDLLDNFNIEMLKRNRL